jgi:(4S)-4-hydroxy-5-phosphonooxypentane-2,3-dione isomerase
MSGQRRGGKSSIIPCETRGLALFFNAMHMIMVRLEVKPDKLDEFLKLVTFNATESRKEPGNLRFDVVRSVDSPTRFGLYEVYRDADGVLAHQSTAHYARWRAEVEALLATPRLSEKFTSVFPEPYS